MYGYSSAFTFFCTAGGVACFVDRVKVRIRPLSAQQHLLWRGHWIYSIGRDGIMYPRAQRCYRGKWLVNGWCTYWSALFRSLHNMTPLTHSQSSIRVTFVRASYSTEVDATSIAALDADGWNYGGSPQFDRYFVITFRQVYYAESNDIWSPSIRIRSVNLNLTLCCILTDQTVRT